MQRFVRRENEDIELNHLELIDPDDRDELLLRTLLRLIDDREAVERQHLRQ